MEPSGPPLGLERRRPAALQAGGVVAAGLGEWTRLRPFEALSDSLTLFLVDFPLPMPDTRSEVQRTRSAWGGARRRGSDAITISSICEGHVREEAHAGS